jgi:hypothetical protein
LLALIVTKRPKDVKTVCNRVHLDVHLYPGDGVEAQAARLRTLGAIAVDLGQCDVPWTVLADPDHLPQADPNPHHGSTCSDSLPEVLPGCYPRSCRILLIYD